MGSGRQVTLLPRRRRRDGPTFSGWRIVIVSALAMGLSGPGQTVGISVFVDPMIAALDLTRSEVALAYLVGTLGGAFALPRIGRLIDDRGARWTMAFVGGVFGALLVVMAGVTGLLTLALGFVGIRMFGQGALGLVATTAVAPWFDRRRGVAIAATTAIGSAILSMVPLVSAFAIDAVGWRWSWLLLGVLVWGVVLPLAYWGMIDRPSDVGQQADGVAVPSRRRSCAPTRSLGRNQAIRTPMFWVVASAVAATGMIGTGLSFHQIDLLGEQGLTPVEAAANFLPQTFASLTATMLVGRMVDRLPARWVLLASMLVLSGAMIGVSYVSPGITAAMYGMAVGAAASATRVLEAAAFPRLFGLDHLGSIRGVVTSLSIGSTAFGPVVLSFGHDVTGSYTRVLQVLLVIPVGVAVLGMLVSEPGAYEKAPHAPTS